MSELFLFCNTLLLILCIGIFSFIASRYKRCPSNKVIVVYGKVGGGACCRCVHGGGVFIWPLIQHYAVLSLEPMMAEINLKKIKTADNINIAINMNFCFAISTDPKLLQNAAVRLLGLDKKQIISQVSNIAERIIKSTVSTLNNIEVENNNEGFLDLINKKISTELNKLGLHIINIKIEDLRDSENKVNQVSHDEIITEERVAEIGRETAKEIVENMKESIKNEILADLKNQIIVNKNDNSIDINSITD